MGASESKLEFKQGVFRLAEEESIPVDSELWASFYQLPETADDVFSLWSPNDLHNLTRNGAEHSPPPGAQIAPKKNLETLIYSCVARLHALQHRRCYADPHQSVAPEALNCMRILTRLLPYIYEAEHLQDWEQSFFWKPRKPQRIWDRRHNRPGQYFDGLNPAKKFRVDEEEGHPGHDAGGVGELEIGPPLGEQLIDLLVRYMFFPNFTLPKKLDAQGLPDLTVNYHIWHSGIGCHRSVGMTKENERNAIEVIRLLLSLCSRQLYLPPQFVADTSIRSLNYMTSKPDRQVVLSVICSLLNSIMKYNPASWRVPIDFSVEGDSKTRLVHLSLQLLLVLLLYPDPAGEANQYRKAMGRLHRAEDFQFIQQGLTMVLTQPRGCLWAPEMLILLWELLQVNKRFRSFIIQTDRAHDFVIMVLYYATLHKDEPAKQGIVRMCILILQTMSVEPAFGKRLNKEFVGQESLPGPLRINSFHGSYADFLITSIHTLMTTTQGRLESMYPALLAIINNIAPYVRDLQRATSSMILNLFVQMSSPKFLLEKDNNHTMLVSLLQAINAILEHQYETNRRFIDVIIRNQKRFKALRDFTIEGAVTELDRLSQERKDRGDNIGLATGSGIQSSGRNGSIESMRRPRLGNVPENGAFSIGEDEDDEDENEEMASSTTLSRSQSATSMSGDIVDDAMPMQSRSMSEKARGKQPVGQGSFSRSTSRNTSAASLPSLITSQSASLTNVTASMQPQFRPSAEWLETWLPHIPLHTVLQVIDSTGPQASEPTTVYPPRFASDAAPPQSQAFVWTSLSLGWYVSLLWGLIYASDVATNKGIHGIWTGTNIKLFNVVASQHGNISFRSPKGAVDAVGDSLARRISSLSFTSPQTIKDV